MRSMRYARNVNVGPDRMINLETRFVVEIGVAHGCVGHRSVTFARNEPAAKNR